MAGGVGDRPWEQPMKPLGLTTILVLTATVSAWAKPLVLYDSSKADHADRWRSIGPDGEDHPGPAWSLSSDAAAYMLWNFPRDWTGGTQLEVHVRTDRACTVSVAVCDDFDSYAVGARDVRAGPATIVLPVEAMVADGIQLPYMKKIAVRARAASARAVKLTVLRVAVTGRANPVAMRRNWMTICDGQGPRSLSMWEPFRRRTVTASDEHATHGGRAVRVVFTGEKFSSIYGTFQPDWRGYRKLVLDVFNPGEQAVTLRIGIRPHWAVQGNVEGVREAELKPGANHIVCDLAKMAARVKEKTGKDIDWSIMHNLALKLPAGKGRTALVFDDVHLEGAGAKRPAPPPAPLTRTHEAEWYDRVGMKDTMFTAKPLAAKEIEAAGPLEMPKLPPARKGQLLAGVAKIDITPAAGPNDKGRKAISNLYARAVCLSDGRITTAFVVVDWTGAYGPVSDMIRELAARLTGMPEPNIFVWGTHNHSCPQVWGKVGETGYRRDALGRVASAVVRAREDMKPVRVRAAKGRADLNFNRRFKHSGGKVDSFLWNKMFEGKWDDGFVDKELGLVVLETPGGKSVASLVAYSGHANMNCVIDLSYNADYPGIVCAELERSTGAPVIVLNGAFGNVDMKGSALSLERTVTAGLQLARAVERLRGKLRPVASAPVACGSETRQGAPAKEGGKPYPITVAGLAFGDVAVVQSPGELYTEFSPQIKAGSPYRFTYTTYWRGYYLPTRKACEEGGYGTKGRGKTWGETCRDASIALLRRIRAD